MIAIFIVIRALPKNSFNNVLKWETASCGEKNSNL